MNATLQQRLAPGQVLGWVTGTPRGGRAEWDAALERHWPRFIELMARNDGFVGAMATWTVETGEVSIVGVWASMAQRLAYEANNSDEIRAIFNALLEPPPVRHKQVISRVHWQGA